MVNEKPVSGKYLLLSILRESSGPVTGEVLGRKIGISRVAVHKYIQTLISLGYPVTTSRRGYSLEPEQTMPLSTWEFQPEEKITVLEAIPSTMDEARRLADKNPGEDFTIAAEIQSFGRGRRRRTWDSPAGGLWATRVIHPNGSAQRIQRYVLAGTAVLAELLRDDWNINAEVKWPNDVVAGTKKIAGILAEASITGDRFNYLSLGLGLNVNNITGSDAVSLKELTGREEDRRKLLRCWVGALNRFLDSDDFAGTGIPAWWNSLMSSAGRRITCTAGGRNITGIIENVDGLGRLVLKVPGGALLRLSPGDVDDKWRFI